jgi:polar amino acid transport system substrate-binding protein
MGLLIALALIGALLLTACGKAPEPEGCLGTAEDAVVDLECREVTMAVENAYPPFNSTDEATGEGVGWDYDAGREICTRLHCVPVFTEAAWDGIFPAMAAGEFDVLFDGVTYTEERDQTVDFSIPYITYGQVLMVRAEEDRFTTPDEFKANPELLIATQLGTTNEATAIDFVGPDRVKSFEDFGGATQAVLAGDADAVGIDLLAASGFMEANPGQLKVLEEGITSGEKLALVFPPGSDLLDPFNQALQSMIDDGTLAEINGKWFPGLEF